MKLLKRKLTTGFILLLGLLFVVTGVGQAQAGAEVGLFEPIEVQPGTAFELPISIRNVEALYGIDIEVEFDPAVLQAEDAAPNTPGVQVGLGTFLDAGLTLYNEVDNEEGVIRFAMTQVNPSEPKSGEGILIVVYMVAQDEGESEMTVSFAEASTREGEAIPIEGVDELVTVSSEAVEQPATDIPVQDPELATIIPTMAPTLTPTITPTFEPTPTPEVVEEETEEAVGEPTDSPGEGETGVEEEVATGEEQEKEGEETGAGILDYWWAVLIVILAAGGVGAYLLLSKKKENS